jgi:hypothetical protein
MLLSRNAGAGLFCHEPRQPLRWTFWALHP